MLITVLFLSEAIDQLLLEEGFFRSSFLESVYFVFSELMMDGICSYLMLKFFPNNMIYISASFWISIMNNSYLLKFWMWQFTFKIK